MRKPKTSQQQVNSEAISIYFDACDERRIYRGVCVTNRPYRIAVGALRRRFLAFVVNKIRLGGEVSIVHETLFNREIDPSCVENI